MKFILKFFILRLHWWKVWGLGLFIYARPLMLQAPSFTILKGAGTLTCRCCEYKLSLGPLMFTGYLPIGKPYYDHD